MESLSPPHRAQSVEAFQPPLPHTFLSISLELSELFPGYKTFVSLSGEAFHLEHPPSLPTLANLDFVSFSSGLCDLEGSDRCI